MFSRIAQTYDTTHLVIHIKYHPLRNQLKSRSISSVDVDFVRYVGGAPTGTNRVPPPRNQLYKIFDRFSYFDALVDAFDQPICVERPPCAIIHSERDPLVDGELL